MKKILYSSLFVILFLVLLSGAGIFFAYSSTGNGVLQSYIEDRLQEETGLPVKVDKFTLDSKQAKLHLSVNKELVVEVVSNYDVWAQSFEGIYRVQAKQFRYEKMLLRQANVKGHFKGLAENFYVDGTGTALDAKLDYKLMVLEQMPRKIKATMQGVKLSEILLLAGQDAVAEGKVDVNIDMPDIGEAGAKGQGMIRLSKGLFNRAFITKKYGYTLPNGSHVNAQLNVKLNGDSVVFDTEAKSNLFTLKTTEGSVDLRSKKVQTRYAVDVKDLRILTRNQLAGPLMVTGEMRAEEEKVSLKGESHSLGGTLRFDVNEQIDLSFENVAISKMLRLLKQPAYASGALDVTAKIEKDMDAGTYVVKAKNGKLNASVLAKEVGYTLPKNSTFTLSSEGKIKAQQLTAKTKVDSSLGEVTLSKMTYGFTNKKLFSNYEVNLKDVKQFMPSKKVKTTKKAPFHAKGTVKFDKTFSVDGTSTGLAKKLTFHYDSSKAKLDAQTLSLEKLLALTGLPLYVHGNVDAKVDMPNVKRLDGHFTLNAKQLSTNPTQMKKLLDKPLKLKFSVTSQGKLQNAVMYADTTVKSTMANLTLKNTVFDTKTQVLKSNYTVDIADMQKLYPLTDKKMYGKMHLAGTLTQDKTLRVSGGTKSLGGNIGYTLVGDNFKSKISTVPVTRVMRMLGIAETVLGNASGVVTYNLATSKGVADIAITSFQIKPSKTTQTVKMFIGKDPARIIFKSTKLHANMSKTVTTFTLRAKGTSASFDITQGRLQNKSKALSAKFSFVYEKYVINGSIHGTSDNPKVEVDPASLVNHKIKKEINKGLNKVLKGKMGDLFKGFKF